jgi:hypothetical protein
MKTFLTLALVLSLFSHSNFIAASDDSAIGYKTVEEAYTALENNPEAVLTEYEGWKIFNIKNNGLYTLWSFTPHVDPAYPAVVKRVIASKNNQILINMSALCEAEKPKCDHLIEQFKAINDGIKRKMENGS